ncbi:MAG: 3-oxoacyl-ACP reductase [Candidatus Rokuibacteriota bacterium]|nr:MAG: 3-oxoacyl-ACP reductase [Candidatus Rokubacteria bacterium]
MSGRFAGQVAIVTAGGSGIGAATARRLAGEGAAVVVADLSGTRAEAVASAIATSGGRAAAIKMDASEPEAVQRTLQRALDTFGRVDVMVNNAGLAEPAPLDEISLQSWNRVIAVTLTSVFLGLKHCLPIMRAQRKGVVVNTASISGMGGDYGLSSYNAATARPRRGTSDRPRRQGRRGREHRAVPGVRRGLVHHRRRLRRGRGPHRPHRASSLPTARRVGRAEGPRGAGAPPAEVRR